MNHTSNTSNVKVAPIHKEAPSELSRMTPDAETSFKR